MLNVRQISVRATGLAVLGLALTACGQKGALYLPTDAAAKNRATLPGLLVPGTEPAAAEPPAARPAPAQPPAGADKAPATGGAK